MKKCMVERAVLQANQPPPFVVARSLWELHPGRCFYTIALYQQYNCSTAVSSATMYYMLSVAVGGTRSCRLLVSKCVFFGVEGFEGCVVIKLTR